jgi:hypothetical protein
MQNEILVFSEMPRIDVYVLGRNQKISSIRNSQQDYDGG